MTVLLVLFFFAFFLLIDHFMARKRVSVTQTYAIRPRILPALVNGFLLPEKLFYHLGHTWVAPESPALARVGLDDFASKMLGTVDAVALPKRNTWIRQGQKFAAITREGKTVQLISPVEGVVTEVNETVLSKPETLRDAYNEGWLVTVNTPDQKTNLRNLLHGNLAKWFIGDAVARLHPALAQDGGEAVHDFLKEMGKDWETTAREFLLN